MSSAVVTITGRLAADPVLRHTPKGLAVANFTVAHTPRRMNDQGVWEDAGDTLWLRVTAWGQLGENAAASLSKGAAAVVVGYLGVSSYQAADGSPRTDVTCTATSVAADLRWAHRPGDDASAPAPLRAVAG